MTSGLGEGWGGAGHLQRLSQPEAIGKAHASSPGPVENRPGRNRVRWGHKSGELHLFDSEINTDTKDHVKRLRSYSHRAVGGLPGHTRLL